MFSNHIRITPRGSCLSCLNVVPGWLTQKHPAHICQVLFILNKTSVKSVNKYQNLSTVRRAFWRKSIHFLFSILLRTESSQNCLSACLYNTLWCLSFYTTTTLLVSNTRSNHATTPCYCFSLSLSLQEQSWLAETKSSEMAPLLHFDDGRNFYLARFILNLTYIDLLQSPKSVSKC